ncbi:hypothetical protein F8388_011685 [Cannabis sativa]|uniref:N-acetyltransferase domain-containing protein n=1 Tax=Cannabis sativa TaxID=3483 RepID=A0A7J6GX75_CANSA|nr:hypothetical protein F8388_011685 [Cannabis sativa]
MGLNKPRPIIRSYDKQVDRARVEDLERRCEVGPTERIFLFTDTMGDPICRIRNSPMYKMLVAELDKELVGVIQGSIKVVTMNKLGVSGAGGAKVGYILGLRVSPHHRRKGIGSSLVREVEEWFVSNEVDYSYMATEKDNKASVKLFVEKFGYNKFRTPAILVNPVQNRASHISSNVEISKVKVEEAECLYRKFMSSAEFFPKDINDILSNKLSLGTWVAYPKGESLGSSSSWAMVSVWNTGGLFKLWLGKAPLSCLIYTKSSRLISRLFPSSCFNNKFIIKLVPPCIPNFFNPFGFYFMYGVHSEGPLSGKLVRSLCQFVHNMAIASKDCKAIVTEVGGHEFELRHHIPHWKLLSCPEDLWCIKALKIKDHEEEGFTKTPPSKPLFVDPRECAL